MANGNERLRSLFSDIADSIRSKTGVTENIPAVNFPQAISSIETGGSGISASSG